MNTTYKWFKDFDSTHWVRKPMHDTPSKPDPDDKPLHMYDWDMLARPSQKVPPGDWRTWLIMAGRGFGKTRMAAETIRKWVKEGTYKRIALIGATELDIENVMLQGDSGLLTVHPSAERPKYSASSRTITWPCGAIAHTFTSLKVARLRGSEFDVAWVDELSKFRNALDFWDQLMLCMRLGSAPRVVVSSTPQPVEILHTLCKDPTTFVTRGSTYENAENLSPAFINEIIKQYEGTNFGEQEIHGQLFGYKA